VTSRQSIPLEASEIWADNWCIPASAPHPVAAHAWINWLLTPSTAVTEMNYHNYKIPMPSALAQLPPSLRDDPMFNVPKTYTDNYHYILNVRPAGRRGQDPDLHGVQGLPDGGSRQGTSRRLRRCPRAGQRGRSNRVTRRG